MLLSSFGIFFRLELWFYNATFNNDPVVLWWSILLMGETKVAGESHIPAASHRQTLLHTFLLGTPRHERDSKFSHYHYGPDFVFWFWFLFYFVCLFVL